MNSDELCLLKCRLESQIATACSDYKYWFGEFNRTMGPWSGHPISFQEKMHHEFDAAHKNIWAVRKQMFKLVETYEQVMFLERQLTQNGGQNVNNNA